MRRGQVPGPEKGGDDQRRSYDWEERERCTESQDFCFPPKSFKKPRPRDFILKLGKRKGRALKQRDQRYQVIIGIKS